MSDNWKDSNIGVLTGEVIMKIEGLEEGSQIVTFTTMSGMRVKLFHERDCCEHVRVYDIVGDVADLQDALVVSAEDVNSGVDPEAEDFPPRNDWMDSSILWTFYKIQTNKGAITLRWLGESNGYYSEAVSCYVCTGGDCEWHRH